MGLIGRMAILRIRGSRTFHFIDSVYSGTEPNLEVSFKNASSPFVSLVLMIISAETDFVGFGAALND